MGPTAVSPVSVSSPLSRTPHPWVSPPQRPVFADHVCKHPTQGSRARRLHIWGARQPPARRRWPSGLASRTRHTASEALRAAGSTAHPSCPVVTDGRLQRLQTWGGTQRPARVGGHALPRRVHHPGEQAATRGSARHAAPRPPGGCSAQPCPLESVCLLHDNESQEARPQRPPCGTLARGVLVPGRPPGPSLCSDLTGGPASPAAGRPRLRVGGV